MVVTGGGTAATVTLAEATAPGPPSTELIVLVVLFFVPNVVPVTLTLKVHEALEASVVPAKLMLPDPAVAVIVPPPQLPVRLLGVETARPAGKVSVKPTPVNVVEPLGLVMVKLSEVELFSTTLPEPKDFAIVGGTIATTVTLADAVPPAPPSTEVTVLVVLFFVPNVVPVTFTPKVHEALDASVAAVKLMLPDPAVAVIVPPPQLPVSPFGVETTSPAGRLSVKPTPVSPLPAFGLLSVKLSEVVPFSGMLTAPNIFPIVGGATAAPVPVVVTEVGPVPAANGEPATGVNAPVPALMVYAETLLELSFAT